MRSRKKINIDQFWSVFLLCFVRTRHVRDKHKKQRGGFREAACLKNAFTVRNFPEPYDNNAVTIRASARRAARWKTKKIICSGYRNKRYDRLPVYRGILSSSSLSLFLSIHLTFFFAPHLSFDGGGESWMAGEEGAYRGLKRDGMAGKREVGIGGGGRIERSTGALYFPSHSVSNSICASPRFWNLTC